MKKRLSRSKLALTDIPELQKKLTKKTDLFPRLIERFRQERIKAGMTQGNMAEIIDITLEKMQRIERGCMDDMKASDLIHMCEALDLPFVEQFHQWLYAEEVDLKPESQPQTTRPDQPAVKPLETPAPAKRTFRHIVTWK